MSDIISAILCFLFIGILFGMFILLFIGMYQSGKDAKAQLIIEIREGKRDKYGYLKKDKGER